MITYWFPVGSCQETGVRILYQGSLTEAEWSEIVRKKLGILRQIWENFSHSAV
jgi:hypothetical protein